MNLCDLSPIEFVHVLKFMKSIDVNGKNFFRNWTYFCSSEIKRVCRAVQVCVCFLLNIALLVFQVRISILFRGFHIKSWEWSSKTQEINFLSDSNRKKYRKSTHELQQSSNINQNFYQNEIHEESSHDFNYLKSFFKLL